MKSKKVLLGLFMGLFALSTGSVMAQTPQDSQLIEVGPNNLGGRVHAIVVDKADTTGQTVYAGAAIGGLFYRNAEHIEWQRIPCVLNGKNVNLPITSMVQAENGMIYIGTGEGAYPNGYNAVAFAPLGYGIIQFNPNTNEFRQVSATPSKPGDDWSIVNKVSIMKHENANGQDDEYLYAATGNGLYRWKLNGNDWDPIETINGCQDTVYQDMELVEARNIAYFTSGNRLYKQVDMFANTELIDISASNVAFTDTNTTRIELAIAPSDPKYLYAMVFDENYMLSGLYLTTNQQNWTLLNTSTIVPFNPYNTGATCAAIAVDNGNPDRVIMAGSTIWIGEGYVPNSYYQWIQSSYSELELNGGDYMAQVFSNAKFVHSGIHQIVPAVVNGKKVNYIATDGGVFVTEDNFNSFKNINLGLNISQIVDVAVAPDGSVISGAFDNGCPFIQSRMNHDGGAINNSWYDSESAMNHLGNVTYANNGGYVATSMFQQVKPQERRPLMVSSDINGTARAYNDYNDYTQTQTWTSGVEFMNVGMQPLRNRVPSMAFFESNNSNAKGDSITFRLDVFMGPVDSLNGAIVYDPQGNLDTIPFGQQIKAGSTMKVLSRGHSNYPFIYTFDKNVTVEEGMTIKTHNPICNRLAVLGRNGFNRTTVYLNWYPTDFSKVYNPSAPASTHMKWAVVFEVSTRTGTNIPLNLHLLEFSQDGNVLYATIDDETNKSSCLVRATGINTNVDYSLSPDVIASQLSLKNGRGGATTLTYDTVAEFDRLITSISANPAEGSDGLMVTFGGFVDLDNVVYINNASTDHPTIKAISSPAKNKPAYSAMIALDSMRHCVKAFIGTEDGLYERPVSGNATNLTFGGSWTLKGDFTGVPVTAMTQQLAELPIERYVQHNGYNTEDYLWAKTKYPYAMYFGTYGRGIFMDMTYVNDTVNEVVEENDWLDIPQIADKGENTVRIYPNPAASFTNIELNVANAGKAMLRVYDLSGKLVLTENMGILAEGSYTHQINCQNLRSGMYLINVVIGNQTATSKLLVR